MMEHIHSKEHIRKVSEQLFGYEEKWITSLMTDVNAYNLFCNIDNEIFIRFGRVPTALLVASAEKGDGRTSIAVLTAVLTAIHEPKKKVLLIDADTGYAGVSGIFGSAEGAKGLNDYFTGDAGFADCVLKSALDNLHIIPASVGGERKLKLSQDRFEEMICTAQQDYGLIVVDSPAAGSNNDTASLAKIVGNVLFVVRYGGPKREQIASVISEFARVNANILGAVLNQRIYPLPKFVYAR